LVFIRCHSGLSAIATTTKTTTKKNLHHIPWIDNRSFATIATAGLSIVITHFDSFQLLQHSARWAVKLPLPPFCPYTT
jgi:hypothetical protein